MYKKVLTMPILQDGVEKEVNLVFRPQERDGRNVWYCDLEDDTITDLETLMKVSSEGGNND